MWETTSGLPDDSREEDERQEARRSTELRGRVRAARAAVANTPGLPKILQSDWKKAAGFHTRYGIAEPLYRRGVPAPANEVYVGLLELAYSRGRPRGTFLPNNARVLSRETWA